MFCLSAAALKLCHVSWDMQKDTTLITEILQVSLISKCLDMSYGENKNILKEENMNSNVVCQSSMLIHQKYIK